MTSLNISPKDLAWEPCGGENGDEPTKLITQVKVAGVPHHLQAFEIEWDEGVTQTTTDPLAEEEFSLLSEAFAGGDPFETVYINGRDYVLFMSPYS